MCQLYLLLVWSAAFYTNSNYRDKRFIILQLLFMLFDKFLIYQILDKASHFREVFEE